MSTEDPNPDLVDHSPVNTSTTDDSPSTEKAPVKKSFFSRFKKQKKDDDSDSEKGPPPVKFRQLFRHATRKEKIYMAIAWVAAIIHGSLLPMFTILFGGIIDNFDDNTDVSQITEEVGSTAKWFLVLAAVAFFTSAIQVRFQLIVAQAVSARLRRLYFKSLMSQDFAWYEANDGGELTARVAGDVNLIQAGIGDKVTSAIQFIAMFIVGIIVAFAYGPLLTLVILAMAPVLIASGAVFGQLAADSTGDGLGAYGSAGAIATEVIGLIRVVTAYNGQQSEIKRYEKELRKAYRSGVKKAIITGLGLGFTMFIIFSTYAVAFTFGAQRLRQGQVTSGDVLVTFFSVFISCVSIGQAAPSFQAFATAQGAAPRVYEVIDRESEINPLDEEDGEIIEDFQGHVSFRDVDFNYPNRIIDDLEDESTREYVLNKFNLDVPPGNSHALVGASGCGKSTTVRLIERFYDIENGSLTLDGVDVRKLNVRWLRSQIGYVGQMPTLFARSIRDNIALGAALEVTHESKDGTPVLRRREISEDEIIEAAKQANAHNFIMKLPEQYDTMLGERGALLSGGQKQRVCIARALIRNPKILILDESTAALDAQSERIVQKALEVASAGRTTITIAHRLSTVKNADTISVIDKGSIVESGRHEELMQVPDGAYRTLIEHQNVEAENVHAINRATDVADGEAKVFTDSISKTKYQDAESPSEEEGQPDLDKGVWLRAFRYNKSEWFFIVLGAIGGAIAGSTFPVMAIVFSEVIDELFRNNTAESVRKWALYFVAIGGGAFLGNFLQLGMLGIGGERLTLKVRREAFKALLKQEMGFFDMKVNSPGALTTRLATEATMVKGMTGDTLGALAFALGALLAGFIIAYVACWRVALVVTTVFPLMAIAGSVQLKLMTGFDADSEKRYAEAGAVASEAVDNIETITAIGVQDVFMKRYEGELETPIRNGRKTALIASIAFGISELLAQALWAVSFWAGSVFVRDGFCEFADLMKAITGLLFGGMMLGQVTTFMPDIGKARVAATKVFRLLDRVSSIDPTTESGTQHAIEGNVKVDKVCFEYPSRPDVAVLRGLSINVCCGQTLALVGASGCGKSTIVALLERFYDPSSGTIEIDEENVQASEVKWLRKHLGFVAQEPDLFNRSVRDNISYGLDHGDGTPVTDEIIIRAAKAANADSFIRDLPDGYDTLVGPRGNKLSGGQRQRVAIARAIVREPKLLLLDEATSALDAVSERVVQEALDRASSGRTTVAIAHRLSTVKDADAIAVVARGKIVESGTHEQLLRIENGEYANLVKNQLSGVDEDSAV